MKEQLLKSPYLIAPCPWLFYLTFSLSLHILVRFPELLGQTDVQRAYDDTLQETIYEDRYIIEEMVETRHTGYIFDSLLAYNINQGSFLAL